MTSEGLTKETLGLRLPLFRIPIAAASNVFGVVRKRAPPPLLLSQSQTSVVHRAHSLSELGHGTAG